MSTGSTGKAMSFDHTSKAFTFADTGHIYFRSIFNYFSPDDLITYLKTS